MTLGFKSSGMKPALQGFHRPRKEATWTAESPPRITLLLGRKPEDELKSAPGATRSQPQAKPGSRDQGPASECQCPRTKTLSRHAGEFYTPVMMRGRRGRQGRCIRVDAKEMQTYHVNRRATGRAFRSVGVLALSVSDYNQDELG